MSTLLKLINTETDESIPGQIYFYIEVAGDNTTVIKKTVHPHIPISTFLSGLETLAMKRGASPLSSEDITCITNTINTTWTTEIVAAYNTYQTIPDLTPQQLAVRLKTEAQSLLSRTDVVVARIQEAISLGETTATAGDVAAFMNYRKALRAIVSGADTTSTTLPTQPAYPAGT